MIRSLRPLFAAATLAALGCTEPARPADLPEPVASAAQPLGGGIAEGDREIVAAAEAGLARFLELVPQGSEGAYGFADRGQMSRARPGAPYQVVLFEHRRSAGPDLDAVQPVEEWRVPVVCDGEARALLTVARVDGALKAVDFGAAVLAKEIGRAEREQGMAGKEARRALVRFPQLRADVVALGRPGARLDEATMVPLTSGRAALGQDAPAEGPWTLKNVVAAARARYRALPPDALR